MCGIILMIERRYAKLGVDVTKVVTTIDGSLIADGFRCHFCGTVFLPDATRQRNRHRCPRGCNKPDVQKGS
jgi:hypothetical protein